MCLRNKDHIKNGSVCQHCLREGVEDPTEPDLNQVSPHLRAIFTQLTLQMVKKSRFGWGHMALE